ncbi:MAG: hypothetical protein NZ519_13515, partial [Bacteroidia bacterium]|nr:hypothetical protein [Bacteroidia bacterium]
AQVICVRGMEHAVRQCEALAKHRSEAQCGMPRPLRQQGARPKKSLISKIYLPVELSDKSNFLASFQ